MTEISSWESLSPELEGEGTLGGPSRPSSRGVVARGIVARVADAPIAYRLPALCQLVGVPLREPAEMSERFVAWLVPHHVAVKRAESAEPIAVGLEIRYEHNDATCSVSALLPTHQFIERGRFEIALEADGSWSVPVGKAESERSIAGLNIARTQGRVGASVSFSSSVCTPLISALGIGSSRCEWVFHRAEEPLFGRDLMTWSFLVLPKFATVLRYRARVSLVAREWFWPTKARSRWIDVECQLASQAD